MRGISAGLVLGLAVGWNIANVGAVAPLLAREYEVALATVGLFTTALFVGHTVTQLPGGLAVDRFGARRAAVLAVLLLAATNAVALAATSPALAVAARLFAGLGTGLGFVAGSEYVRAAGGSAGAQGLYGAAGVGGGGFALAIVPQLAEPLAWRAPYATALALALVALLVLAFAPPQRLRPARRTAPLRTLASDALLYRFAAIHGASFGLGAIAANWVVTLLERRGASLELAGALGAFTLLGGVATRPLGGWLVRRFPRHARTTVGSALAAGALGALVLAAPGPLLILALACVLLGLAAGIPFAAAFAGAQTARPDAPGAAIGFVNTWSALAIVVGTPLVGLTFDLAGDGRLGFLALGGLWAAAILAVPRRV